MDESVSCESTVTRPSKGPFPISGRQRRGTRLTPFAGSPPECGHNRVLGVNRSPSDKYPCEEIRHVDYRLAEGLLPF